jgi:hypothetical protein
MRDGAPARPRQNPGVPCTWHVALLYAALTVALAYPLARHAATHVLSVSPDTDLFLWTLSWDTYAFTHHPFSIFDANIFSPQHRTLAYSENLIGSALFAAPVLWLTHNPVLAMNLVALLSCALCGVGGYLLARVVGVGLPGAALSGLIFAFAPPRFLRLDQLFLTTIQWVPFGLAYLHAYFDEGKPFDLRMAIAFFTLQALTSGHGAVFLALASAALFCYRILLGEPLALGRRLRDVGAVGALLLAPVVFIALAYAQVQGEMGLKRTLADWLMVKPSSFLASPTYVHSFLLARLFPDAQINDNADAYLFPGYIPLLLAAVALLGTASAASGPSQQSNRWTRAALAADIVFLASATVAVLVSVGGPVRLKLGTVVIFSARESWRAWSVAAVSGALRVAIARHAPFQIVPRIVGAVKGFTRWLAARRQDAMTFYVLLVLLSVWLSIGSSFGLWPFVHWLPGFNFIRAPSRFMLLAVLGLSVLAGAGFDRVSMRLAASTRLLVAAIVAALIVAEFAVPLGSTADRVEIPSPDRWLAQQPKPFAVAEVPLPPPGKVWEFQKRQSEYMLHSMAHWQKTVHGWSGLQPPSHMALYYRMRDFPSEDSVRWLTEFRVDYIVVHTDLYPPGEWTEIERRLSAFHGWIELRYADDAGRVYALRRAPDLSR